MAKRYAKILVACREGDRRALSALRLAARLMVADSHLTYVWHQEGDRLIGRVDMGSADRYPVFAAGQDGASFAEIESDEGCLPDMGLLVADPSVVRRLESCRPRNMLRVGALSSAINGLARAIVIAPGRRHGSQAWDAAVRAAVAETVMGAARMANVGHRTIFGRQLALPKPSAEGGGAESGASADLA